MSDTDGVYTSIGRAAVCPSPALLMTEAAGRRLGRAVTNATPDDMVVVDLRPVRHAGYRALDELLSAIAHAHVAHAGRFVCAWLERDNIELVAALEAAANQHGIALPLVFHPDGGRRLVGKLTKSERDTLDLVVHSGGLTSASLRSHAQLRTPSASNRLRRLYRLGLVGREEQIVAGRGGRQFIYKALVSGATGAER